MPKFMRCNVHSNSAHELLCTQINVKLIDFDLFGLDMPLKVIICSYD